MNSSFKPTIRSASIALIVVGGAFSYGFVAAKTGLFPSQELSALRQFLSSDAPGDDDASGPPGTPMETGWWVPEPDRLSAEDVTRDLGALGYSQSYGAAGDEALGVVVHDPERAQAGSNLIVSAHAPSVILADMSGATLHEWSFDFADVPLPDDYELPGLFGTRYFRRAALLPQGELLAIYDRTGLIKLDRDSKLLWSLVGGYHHDLSVSNDGSLWVLTLDYHIVPRIHETTRIFEDFVEHISAEGEVLSRVSLLEAFENSAYASLLETVDATVQGDIFHTNSLAIFEDEPTPGGQRAHSYPFTQGMALVSIWSLDVVAVVDLERVEVIWALGGMWHRQHEPVVTDDGKLLVFDNMGHHGMSKIIELDPFTQKTVWSFEGNEENGFYSALCGSVQRLENGNTLITESLAGRAFEVTSEGETVWRFVSPFRVGKDKAGVEGVAVLMEVIRLASDLDLDWL